LRDPGDITCRAAQPKRIVVVRGIGASVPVQVDAASQPDGVFLRKLTRSAVSLRFCRAKSLSFFLLAARSLKFSSYFAQFR
jgi:hypothetical protein